MHSVVEKKRKNFRIQAPIEKKAQTPEQAEVQKYIRLMPDVANPNLGRVQEIKEEIKKGTYLTREMIEEAASQLALRLLKRNSG